MTIDDTKKSSFARSADAMERHLLDNASPFQAMAVLKEVTLAKTIESGILINTGPLTVDIEGFQREVQVAISRGFARLVFQESTPGMAETIMTKLLIVAKVSRLNWTVPQTIVENYDADNGNTLPPVDYVIASYVEFGKCWLILMTLADANTSLIRSLRR